jgi:hypothetical protein
MRKSPSPEIPETKEDSEKHRYINALKNPFPHYENEYVLRRRLMSIGKSILLLNKQLSHEERGSRRYSQVEYIT